MIKYIVVFNDKIIKRGESEYYYDFRDIIPYGYCYVWALRSPGGLMINVKPGVQKRKLDVQNIRVQVADTWQKDKNEPYRMDF